MLWGGLATSALGDQLGIVAIAWIAVGAFGAAAGYLAALQAGITVLAGLLAGRWIEGFNERRLMIAADAVRAMVLLGVVAVWEASSHVGAVALVLLVAVLAAGQTVFAPSVQTIMPELTPSPEMLPAVNALLDGTARMARVGGPAFVALIASRLPTIHFLTLDAGSFLASAAAVLAIGARPTRAVRSGTGQNGAALRGFRALRRDRLLRFLLHTSGINNGVWYAAMFLGLPLLLARDGYAGPDGVRAFGIVLACYGLANLGSNLVVGSRPLPQAPARMILSGNMLTGGGIALIGLAALHPGLQIWPVCAGAAIAGSGGPINDIPRTTLMQTVPPAADIAAGFRAWLVMANAGILLAMTAAPTLFQATGAAAGIAMLGALMAATAALGLLFRFDAEAGALQSAPAANRRQLR